MIIDWTSKLCRNVNLVPEPLGRPSFLGLRALSPPSLYLRIVSRTVFIHSPVFL